MPRASRRPRASSARPARRLSLQADLRTDAITQPTEEMWEAMRLVRPAIASVGEDSTVSALENLAATLTGKGAAVLAPTGTAANIAALLTHTKPGEQVILEADSHILWSEEQGFGALAGLVPRVVSGTDLESDLERIIEDVRLGHRPRTSLLCVENTHTGRGGSPVDAATMGVLSAAAHQHGLAVHVDGARIFNASVALGTPVENLVRDADSVMISLNKGLSAPHGALLCGSTTFIRDARTHLRRIGAASCHQAGIWAAAGIVALERMVDRLAEDHAVARLLGERLQNDEGLLFRRGAMTTNIVLIDLAATLPSASDMCKRLTSQGIGALPFKPRTIRFVTHRHVQVEAVTEVAQAVSLAAYGYPASR
jgi:threonine aldolase